MRGPSLTADPGVLDELSSDLNISVPFMYGGGGLLVGVMLMLVLGFRRRGRVVHVRSASQRLRRPTPGSTRAAAALPFRLPFSVATAPLRPARVMLVPPTRVRLITAGSAGAGGRACRFCGLSLDDGEHATCQQGVLDG